MQVVRPIFCKHEPSKQVFSNDGEVVCSRCGVVLGRESPTCINSQSITNLFLDVEIGSKPNRSFKATKYTQRKSNDLMALSNICQAINIPPYLSNDIWYWYNKIRANIKMTKSKVVVLVFYQMCRFYKFPLDESKLLDVIKINLNVIHVHSSLNVLAEANSFVDESGNLTIQKIGFTEFNSHNITFLLNSKIKSLHEKYPPHIISKIENISRKLSLTLTGTNEQISKMAIKLAKKRCGVC